MCFCAVTYTFPSHCCTVRRQRDSHYTVCWLSSVHGSVPTCLSVTFPIDLTGEANPIACGKRAYEMNVHEVYCNETHIPMRYTPMKHAPMTHTPLNCTPEWS